jgi:hypothetical protein
VQRLTAEVERAISSLERARLDGEVGGDDVDAARV